MSWGLPPRSECLGGQPAVQGNLGQCPRARVVHHLSRATQAGFAGPTGSNSPPGRLGPGSDGPLGRPLVRATGAVSQGPRDPPDIPGDLARVPVPAISTRSPWRIALGSEGPQGRPSVPGDSGPGPRSRKVNQLSRAIRASVRGPAWSTICPGRLRFQCPRGLRPVLAGLPLLRWHAVSTGIPGKLRSGLRPRGVDQQARLTRAHVPGPSGSTRYPGRPGPGFQCPRARPAVLAALGLALKARGFDPLSRATRALFRGTAVSTSSPGHLANRCDIPRCGRAVLGDSGQGPMARGNHQHSWVTISPGQLATVSEIPRSRPAVPCDPGPGPRSQV